MYPARASIKGASRSWPLALDFFSEVEVEVFVAAAAATDALADSFLTSLLPKVLSWLGFKSGNEKKIVKKIVWEKILLRN